MLFGALSSINITSGDTLIIHLLHVSAVVGALSIASILKNLIYYRIMVTSSSAVPVVSRSMYAYYK